MMRQLSIRSTGTMGYREIPLYTSKRLTSEPPDRGEVYRHTFNYRPCVTWVQVIQTAIRNSKSTFAFQRRNN